MKVLSTMSSMILKATVALLLISCCPFFTSAGEKSHLPYSLEEVLSIGDFDDNVLFQWIGIAVDADGCIYVTDGMDYSLKKFTSSGQLLCKAGRRGQGPGEFLAPRLLGCSDKRVYVTDQSILGIHVYDRDLKYLDRIPFRYPVGDLKVFSDSLYAIAAYTIGQSGKVVLFDEKGNVLKEYLYSDEKGPVMMNWVSFEIDSHCNLYIAYSFQDKLEKFDPAGNKIWSKSLLGVRNVPRKKVGPWKVPQSLVYKDIALDSLDRVYLLGGGFSEHPSRDVYLLSPEGDQMAVFTLPEKSHCIYIDRWNRLYSRSNEGVTLKKYKIIAGNAQN